jgi:hypothetical protein
MRHLHPASELAKRYLLHHVRHGFPAKRNNCALETDPDGRREPERSFREIRATITLTPAYNADVQDRQKAVQFVPTPTLVGKPTEELAHSASDIKQTRSN